MTDAAQAVRAQVYDPPESLNDPRICKVCLRTWSRALDFQVKNTRTGKWHTARHETTDCGSDATGGNWLWPL